MVTRILIVDDHPAVREGLAVRISSQADLEVCGEVGEMLNVLAAMQPDVAVVDIQLETGDGLELVKRIKEKLNLANAAELVQAATRWVLECK